MAIMYDKDEQVSSPTPFLKKLQSDPMTYHPLREQSPGRIRCRRDLFDDEESITTAMIFSLLVWRGFPQVFSWHSDASMYFESPEGFLEAYQRIKKERPSDDVVSDVQSYWETLRERRWSRFAETHPSFEECYQHFKPSGTLQYRLFPKLSRTNTFDVACNLAYAGFCRPPTVADVAKYVVYLNKGAMSGLKSLGLVDGKKQDVDAKRAQVTQALTNLADLLKDIPEFMDLKDDEDATYSAYPDSDVDPMRVEHLLRTFSHALKYL